MDNEEIEKQLDNQVKMMLDKMGQIENIRLDRSWCSRLRNKALRFTMLFPNKLKKWKRYV